MTKNLQIWVDAINKRKNFNSEQTYMTYDEKKEEERKLDEAVELAWNNLSLNEMMLSTSAFFSS